MQDSNDWLLEKVIAFSEKCFENSDNIHGMLHASTTAKYASNLAQEEGADKQLCVIAAWLHDIGRTKWYPEHSGSKNHGIDGAKKAEKFLLSIGISQVRVKQVCKAISKHCFAFTQENTIEKILWDADKLNLFTKVMEKEYLKYWMKKRLSKEQAHNMIHREQKQYLKSFHTKTAIDIAHAYEKKPVSFIASKQG
ncbi:MAG: HD domain-containing protein [Candidatus Heimdallarchaeota archaeon]